MCAILGFGFQRGNSINYNEGVWKALTELFINSQQRGRISTGMAITNRKDTVVVKDAVSATQFTATKGYNEILKRWLNFKGGDGCELSPPISVIGHCRFPTKGSEKDNHNNHPISSGKCVGVHNGGISGDEDLWIRFAMEGVRKGLVDSEVIFALIDYFIESGDKKHANTADAIIEASEHLHGGYACAMVNTRNPYCVWLFKNTMPCIVRHYYNMGMVAWASQPVFLDRALPKESFGPSEETILEANSGMGIDLHRSQFETFKLKTPSYKRRSYLR